MKFTRFTLIMSLLVVLAAPSRAEITGAEPSESLNSIEDYLAYVQPRFSGKKSKKEDANGRSTQSTTGGGGGGGGGGHSSAPFAPTLELLPLSGGTLSNEPEVVHVVVRDNEPSCFYRAWLMRDKNAELVSSRIAAFAILKVVNAHIEYEELDLHEMESVQLHCIVLDEFGNEVRRVSVPGTVTAIGGVQFIYWGVPYIHRLILHERESVLSVLEMCLRPDVNTPVRMHRTLAPTVNLMDPTAVIAYEFNMKKHQWEKRDVLPAGALDCAAVGAPLVNQFWLINDHNFTVLLDATPREFELPAGAGDLLIAEFVIRAQGTGGIWKLAEKASSATTALTSLTLVVNGSGVLPGTRFDRGTSGALWLCDASELTFSATEEVLVEIWVNTDPALESGDTLLHVQDVEVGNYSEEFNILFANRFIAGDFIRFSGLWDFSLNPSGLAGFSFSH